MKSAKTLLQKFLLALGILFVMSNVANAARDTGFLNRTVVVQGQTYKYQIYVPADYTSSKHWPVILFLHGVGERGDDGLKQTNLGLPNAIRTDSGKFPFIVVMPQSRLEYRWISPEMQAMAFAELEKTIKEFHGDRSRAGKNCLSTWTAQSPRCCATSTFPSLPRTEFS